MSTKICKRCELDLELSNFYLQVQKSKDKTKSWNYYDCYCKSCRSAYQTNRRVNIKLLAMNYLGGKCEDCGLIDEPYIFDFHHLDPTQKDFSIGKVGVSFDTLKPELDKCILLCSNCHRRRHKSELPG